MANSKTEDRIDELFARYNALKNETPKSQSKPSNFPGGDIFQVWNDDDCDTNEESTDFIDTPKYSEEDTSVGTYEAPVRYADPIEAPEEAQEKISDEVRYEEPYEEPIEVSQGTTAGVPNETQVETLIEATQMPPLPPTPYSESESDEQLGDEVEVKKKSLSKGIIITIIASAAVVVVGIVVAFLVLGKDDSSVNTTSNASDTETELFVDAKDLPVTVGGNTFQYTGALNENNLPDGEGVGVYEEGTYEGTYVDGIREGDGEYRAHDGSESFKGTFKNNMYEEGRVTFDDGTYFVGTFKDGDVYNGAYYSAAGELEDMVKKGEILD